MEKEEHLAIVSLNSCFKKGGYLSRSDWGSSFRKLVLMEQFSVELYEL